VSVGPEPANGESMDSDRDDRNGDSLEGIEFEWYPLKAAANLKKHKVSFDEARTVFGDENALVVPDRVYSDDEERSLIIGRSEQERLLIVCFTERSNRLRIISARPVEPWERREYENANQ